MSTSSAAETPVLLVCKRPPAQQSVVVDAPTVPSNHAVCRTRGAERLPTVALPTLGIHVTSSLIHREPQSGLSRKQCTGGPWP